MRNDINNQVFDLITIRPADPAAGANFSYNVPDGQRLHIIGVQFKITTAIAVANRLARLCGVDATGSFICCLPAQEQVASLTRIYNFSIGSLSQAEVASLPYIQTALCHDLFLRDDEALESSVITLQAADAITDITIRARKYDSRWVETTQ